MTSWIAKALLQGVISLAPYPEKINYFFQRYGSKQLKLTEKAFEDKLALCQKHLNFYRQYTPAEKKLPASILEIGTGWLLIVPVGLALCQHVEKVTSLDKVRLFKPILVKEVLEFFMRYAQDNRLSEWLSDLDERKLPLLKEALQMSNPLEALQKIGVHPIVADARYYQSPPIDFFVSNSTFEHIPFDISKGILTNYRKLAAPHAVMSHLIDMTDHYRYFDPSITPYNFLKFPAWQWRWVNNTLQYQNRLRLSDYRRLYQETGFQITHEENTTSSQADLDSISIARDFQHYSHEDLLTTETWMVSVPASEH